MKKNLIKDIVISLISSVLITGLIGSGILHRPDRWLQDTLFQRPQAVDDEIVIIGIDDETLKQFGPYHNWDRTIMASALEQITRDKEHLPSVVAIDTLYDGETDPEADRRLAEAAGKVDLVTASTAVYGSTIVFDKDGSYRNEDVVVEYMEPYEALKKNSTQGHINAMCDTDGVLRHAILYVEPKENTRVYSMASTVAAIHMRKQGLDPKFPKTNKQGFFYVPFSSRPEGFYDGISLADVINGDVSPEYFEGKIVLIGPYAAGLEDAYFTPIDRSKQMYGVEFQANVIRSILDENYKTEVGSAPLIAVAFLICLATCFIFLRSRATIATAAGVIFTAASIVLSILAYENGYVTHPLWAIMAVLPPYLVAAAVHYFRATMEKQSVVRTFERYVAPNIVNEILREGTENLSLGGKTCDIAVLFVDVRGFTPMSEKLEPEKVVDILNRYLTMANECVVNNAGTLDKFIGDAAMAFWGAPLKDSDPVYHAAKAAMAIQEGAKVLSKQLQKEMGLEFYVGIGINYGPAVVGNMGSEHHMDYTAIGDTVNTASRLESNAPKGTIYVSKSVAENLKDRATFTSLGNSIKLKGKSEDFEVLTLDSLKEVTPNA